MRKCQLENNKALSLYKNLKTNFCKAHHRENTINFLSENKIEILILLLTGLIINISNYLQLFGFTISFLDTDDYMRLIRINEFFHHRDWFNNIIQRSNVPFGCDLHWTRFYDFFLIIPSYLLSFFTDSTKKAVEYVGFFISPIVKSITVILIFNIFYRFMKKDDGFLIALCFVTNALIFPFGSFGRPDHHAFIMLFMVIFLRSVFNFSQSELKRDSVKIALITALCVWISPENLIPLLITDCILFIHMFGENEKLEIICKKNLIVSLLMGIIVITTLKSGFLCMLFMIFVISLVLFAISKKIRHAVILFILLALTLFIPTITPIEYDKISVVHFSLYLFSSIFFAGIAEYSKKMSVTKYKMIYTAVLSTTLAILFLSLFPRFLYGMGADIDSYVKEIWLNKISEMRSPFEHRDGVFFIIYTISVSLAVINKVFELIRRRSNSRSIFWWIIIGNAVCYTFFASLSYRMLPYSVLFNLPLIEDLCMNSKYVKSYHRIVRLLITFVIAVLMIFLISLFKKENNNKVKQNTYTKSELFAEIEKITDKESVIMAHSNHGPEILYHTKHKVVGAPYHRQSQGIIACYEALEKEYNENFVRKILKSTGSEYIFIKKPSNNPRKTSSKSGLASMIVNGYRPDWLIMEKLPKKFDDIIFAKINPKWITTSN